MYRNVALDMYWNWCTWIYCNPSVFVLNVKRMPHKMAFQCSWNWESAYLS